MKQLNDLKELVTSIFYSIQLNYRIHIPFSISLISILYVFMNPKAIFWRGTMGDNLLGLFYFVLIYSIINLIEIRKIELKRKILINIENYFFIIFSLIVYRILTMEVNIFGSSRTINYLGGLYPLLKISLIFLITTYVINRKKITEITK